MAKSDFLIRASSSGSVMTDKRGHGITEKQLETLETLLKKNDDVGVTQAQGKKLKELIAKRDAPFDLSDTCKLEIVSTFLRNKKKVRKYIYSKYLDKGNLVESGVVDLMSKVDGIYYSLNQERITKGHLTGECDVIHDHKRGKFKGLKVVDDMKASWDAFTFMEAELSKAYEWQGRCYMELYGADVFRLRYGLVDCPEHIYQGELYKLKMNENMIDEHIPENQVKVDQLRQSLMFSENAEFQDLEERVKTYVIHRDDKVFKQFLDRVPACKKFYDSLKLNKIWR